MDIINRLKTFVAEKNIPVTQFADICNISRPTLSQILNGRNKKISDEIISKIHVAFPELSVYWLMFGEGAMTTQSTTHVELKNQGNLSGHSKILKSEEENKYGEYPGLFAEKADMSKPITDRSNDALERTITKIVVFYSDNSYESFGRGTMG